MGAKKTKKTASELVFDHMMDLICQGEWRPEDKIPSENKLCEMFGVSRITVRAAIQRLVSINVLESRQGEGTYVCNPTTERRLDSVRPLFTMSKMDRKNVFEFRRTIEVGEVKLAAQRSTEEQTKRMCELSEKMELAVDADEIAEYDLEFHRCVAEATGNPIFVQVFDMMRSTYRTMFDDNVSVLGGAGAKYHKMIAYALEMRDSGLAQTLMKKHLDISMEATETYEKNNGEASKNVIQRAGADLRSTDIE